MTLREFYSQAAHIHGLAFEAARTITRGLRDDGCPDVAPRARSGPDASPVLTAPAAALWLLAPLAGETGRTAAKIAYGLHGMPVVVGGKDPVLAQIIGDDFKRVELAPCSITGRHMFGLALEVILANAGLAAQIDRIEVRRGYSDAAIIARDGRLTRFSYEPEQADAAFNRGEIAAFAHLSGVGLEFIANLISAG
jgi:hypothetical protein